MSLCLTDSKKTLFELYEEFKSHAANWSCFSDMEGYMDKIMIHEKTISKSKNKKRKIESTSTLTDEKISLLTRLRFVNALKDLHEVGMINIHASKLGVDSSVCVSKNS